MSAVKPPTTPSGKSKREEKANKLKQRASAPVAPSDSGSSSSQPREKGSRFMRRSTQGVDGGKKLRGRAAKNAAKLAAEEDKDPAAAKTEVGGKAEGEDRGSRRWSRKDRKMKRNSAPQPGEADDAAAAEGGAVGTDGVGEEGGVQEVVQKEEKAAVLKELDILRTARISKKGCELNVTHTYPEVKLTAYGERWTTDCFALIHNAIKAELRDMYSMAVVMQRRKMLLTLRHIDVFYEWWLDFKEFVWTALDIEEEVLFKWIGSKDYLRGAFKKSERMRVNGATRKVIDSVSEYKEKFLPYLPVGERLEGLLQLLDGFNGVLEHYDAVAQQLPGYLETLFKQKEKDANSKEVVQAFRNADGYNRNLVLLSRWMPERAMKRWAFNNLRSKDLISFRGWRTMIQREHCTVAAKFEEIVMEEEEASLGAPVIGAAMAINEEMRDHIDNNRVSVRNLPKSAFNK